MKEPQKIADLIIKFLHNNLDTEEKAILDEWLSKSEKNRLMFERIKNRDYIKEKLSTFNQIDPEHLWDKIIHRIPYQKRLLLNSRNWYRHAAAAIIFITGASVLLYNSYQHVKMTAQADILRNHDLLPGGNRATLTLGDGTQIVLDSTRNGNLSKQGNTAILKIDNQLVYNSAKAKKSEQILYNTVTTPRGGQYQIALPDGSLVWLNAASSITFPTAFKGKERRIKISGEVYLEVSKLALSNKDKMPFIVELNGVEVRVLGTRFNINAYEDEREVKVTLLEGSVNVKNLYVDEAKTIEPGEQAILGSSGNIDTKLVDIEEAVAWKNGYFQFENASLQSVMRQISRWYDVNVSYEGNPRKRQFGGKIKRDVNASEILKILEESNVHFDIQGKNIIVKP
ncbi:MAG: hypothetical protein A2X18_13170 [Bacteroidetes bacterium GWF2_40_14]|nr:MAG: hypothetical protein A2X18_13170 [Bacteroidetes bacterium GWF2_40_14]